ncbi:MAG TPA: pilus assembly protein TadG-related protein [Terracidiphilus sp.]|nr:pilus assembly protein TadG-related protein [Terracidiphilus sp.]
MKPWKYFFTCGSLADESGQVVPWMAVLLTLLFAGLCTLVVDVGRCVVANHMLQAATDAAALAGVQIMPTATSDSQVTTQATNFSAVPGDKNASDYWLPNASMVSGYPQMYCSSTVTGWGVACNPSINASSGGANALVVKQTVTLPLYFGSIIGHPTMTIGATSTASMRGSQNYPYNIAMVIDTTASMNSNDSDSSCGNTRIYCALQGLRTLLNSLSPCTTSSTSSSCTSFDSVSLFTFPTVSASTAGYDSDCSSKTSPAIVNYYTPVPGATWSAPTGSSATYQITTYGSDWSSTNQKGGSFSSSSGLAIAAGGVSSCGSGMQAVGGVGTYYAGAIYAAQSSLLAAQAANPDTKNALIILSDGDASSSKITTSGTTHASGSTQTVGSSTFNYTVAYPSSSNQCQQAIDAAKNAQVQGTTVYSIAYGASSSGCSTDTSGALKGLSPCTALKNMASNAGDFYSDATASQNSGQCTSSSHPNLTLNQIFQTLASSFTEARLIPNGTA